MKQAASLILATMTLVLTGCGGKSSGHETPAPTNSSNGTGAGAAGPTGARGENGSPGARGPIGPGSAFPYTVKDANGTAIGDASWDSFGKFNDGNTFSFQASDGSLFSVNPTNGYFSGGAYCFYASTDCSGTCLFPISPGAKNKLIRGKTSFFWLQSAAVRTQQLYSSNSMDDGAGGSTCVMAGAPSLEWLVAVPNAWQMPAGLTYPIAVPLDLAKTP
jgi:hypothetical protein